MSKKLFLCRIGKNEVAMDLNRYIISAENVVEAVKIAYEIYMENHIEEPLNVECLFITAAKVEV